MNPIRREVLNGLFVLVISTLLSAAIAAFQINFNLQLWLLIVMAAAIAVSGYVVFEIAVRSSAATAESTRQREEEWLKRVGTPARLEMNQGEANAGLDAVATAVKAISPGSDYTVMYYVSPEGIGYVSSQAAARGTIYSSTLEQLKRGKIREYKAIICFDQDVLANDHELKSGILRVGEGAGTIDRPLGEHCRLMMETKGFSLYVAPALLRQIVALYGVDKVSMTVETADQKTGGRVTAGVIFFCDPPNGEIVEQFRQMERETERRMVAVHKIIFPEDTESTAKPATR